MANSSRGFLGPGSILEPNSVDHDACEFSEEAELQDVLDQLAVDRFGPVPVEVGDRLGAIELGAADATLQAAMLALVLLGTEVVAGPTPVLPENSAEVIRQRCGLSAPDLAVA